MTDQKMIPFDLLIAKVKHIKHVFQVFQKRVHETTARTATSTRNGKIIRMCMLLWFPSQAVFWPYAERKKHNFQVFSRMQLAEVNMTEKRRWV